MLVAAAEGVLSFSRNKSRETKGVGRRWSLLSAVLGGKQGRAGQRQRVVQRKGERSRGERVVVARRSDSGQRGSGGWKQRQGKEEGRAPGGALPASSGSGSGELPRVTFACWTKFGSNQIKNTEDSE